MPELPDVETFRRRLERGGLRRRVRALTLRRRDLLVDLSDRTLRRRTEGASLLEARRHGKHLFARLDGDGGWLRLHFGMTGTLACSPPDAGSEDEPANTQLRLDFEDGGFLAYTSTRALGELGLVEDPDAFAEARGLGPDALAIGLEPFVERLAGSRAMVKTALTDQDRLAGLGNVYADEVLLRAGLHPKTRAAELERAAAEGLYRAMREVLEQAIDAEARPDRLPDGFILPDRREGAPCPRCGGSLRRITVSGRGTFLCPACQQR